MSKSGGSKSGSRGGRTLLRLVREPQHFRQLLDEFEAANRDFYLAYRDRFLQTVDQLRALFAKGDEAGLQAAFPSLPGPFQEAILEWVVEEGKAAFLVALLAAVEDKDLRRALKAAAHRLRAKGIAVETESRAAVFRPAPVPAPETQWFATTVDGGGDFLVAVGRRSPTTGLLVFHAILSHDQGVVDSAEYAASRGEFRKFLDRLRGRVDSHVVEVEKPFVLFALARAHALSMEKKLHLPEGFVAAWKRLSAEGEPPMRHPAWELPDAEEAARRTELLNRTEALHELSEFRNWLMDMETLMRFELRLHERQSSRLVLNDAQADDYVADLIDRTVDEYFGGKRRRYADALCDMAYLFGRLERPDDAHLCLAAARALTDESQPPARIPFARRMLTRLIRPARQPKAEPQLTPGGIILPGR